MQRAHTLISRCISASHHDDSLPKTVSPNDLLEVICSPCDPPPFASAMKDRRKQDKLQDAFDDMDHDLEVVDI